MENGSVSSIGSDDRARYDSDSSEGEDLTLNEQFNRDLQPAKDNNPSILDLFGCGDNERIQNFTDEEWVEIGRALSKNTHLEDLHFYKGALNDHKMSLLFRGLTSSSSIKALVLNHNKLRTGIKCMLPFLQNASNLVELDLGDNSIQSEEFTFLLGALCDSPVKTLNCGNCDIESIQIDNDRYMAKLKILNLHGNRINEDGCREIAKLLKKPDCALELLDLCYNHVNDVGIEILVDALQNNASLTDLHLEENKGISIDGKIMMLKLVNDISSVEATLQSNHTLRAIHLNNIFFMGNEDNEEMIVLNQIYEATRINVKFKCNAAACGREKLIQFQLQSKRRSILAKLQKVHQSVYSEISPLYLPELLPLVGRSHGQGELFAAVKSSIVALLSIGNRKKRIKEARDYYLARAEQLTAELAAIEAEEEDGAKVVRVESRESEIKRRRK